MINQIKISKINELGNMLSSFILVTALSILLAWAQIKGHIKANTSAFNLREVEQLVQEGYDVVTPDRWKSLIEHVKIHFEDNYWSNDGLYEKLVDKFIIQVGGESDESDDSDQSDSSDDEYFSQSSFFAKKFFSKPRWLYSSA